MQIRLAQPEDLPLVVDIANWAAANTAANFAVQPESLDSWRRSWEETHPCYPWLVAEDDGRIIGFAKASRYHGRCAYDWTAEVTVYVHPDHHGKRVGTALYEQLIPLLKAQGYATLIAAIATPNPASVRLHQRFGFRKTGTLHRVGWKFNRWHDVEYWEAFLQDSNHQPGALRPVTDVLRIQSQTEEGHVFVNAYTPRP